MYAVTEVGTAALGVLILCRISLLFLALRVVLDLELVALRLRHLVLSRPSAVDDTHAAVLVMAVALVLDTALRTRRLGKSRRANVRGMGLNLFGFVRVLRQSLYPCARVIGEWDILLLLLLL
jgi:hypothetical protein